ncbi:HNH endonuclease [Bradyrhizobium canariense]|uniref:HNH endonuclease n=1 Tax=Bradyrhizobium canariense TaxID=255045 RepID=A0A1H1MJI5_9BRAD|nr:HNH endonuclease [Bradyrhizobium canariense]SDR87014.1 HNH endonuclease [Bradyrhizobium canariense]
MICIFCLKEREPSVEHVFPNAIGGRLTTNRVCKQCNSLLGSQIDSALTDFLFIRQRRAELGLAGNSGEPPGRLDWLTGRAEVVGEEGGPVRTSFDPINEKLTQTRLYTVKETIAPDGQSLRQIIIDTKDKDKIPVIIQRERRRHGFQSLSDEELAKIVGQVTASPVEKVSVIKKDINVSFNYLRHAMFKIAYELAFLWLGESYLDDPLAAQIRTAICSEDVCATDNLYGHVGFLAGLEPVFNRFWIPHGSHHLAYSTFHFATGKYAMAVRIFDIYAAMVPVSSDTKYADVSNWRFFAQDAVSGRTANTSFIAEQGRLGQMMTETRRIPPFPDPLAEISP